MLGFCGCWLDGRNGWAHRPTLGLDGLFSLFLSVMVVAFPFYSVCVCVCHPYSLRSLRFCVCSPVCAVVIPLFVLQCFDFSPPLSQFCVLFRSVYCGSFAVFQLHRLSPPPLRCRALLLSLHPIPDRRATAYCTYVFSFKV